MTKRYNLLATISKKVILRLPRKPGSNSVAGSSRTLDLESTISLSYIAKQLIRDSRPTRAGTGS